MPFDFAVFLKGFPHLIALIEFHGEQHYRPVTFGSRTKDPKENLRRIQQSDSIKKEYCNDKQIPLLVIRWDEADEIETKIDEFIETVKNNSEPSEKSDCAA